MALHLAVSQHTLAHARIAREGAPATRAEQELLSMCASLRGEIGTHLCGDGPGLAQLKQHLVQRDVAPFSRHKQRGSRPRPTRRGGGRAANNLDLDIGLGTARGGTATKKVDKLLLENFMHLIFGQRGNVDLLADDAHDLLLVGAGDLAHAPVHQAALTTDNA